MILLVRSFAARMPLLAATSAFGLGRRRWSSPQQCYLHRLRTLLRTLLTQLCTDVERSMLDVYLYSDTVWTCCSHQFQAVAQQLQTAAATVDSTYQLTTATGWWRGTVVERRSLAGELSLSCA